MACSRRDAKLREREAIAKSFRLSIIDWMHVAQLYIPYVLGGCLALALASLIPAHWQSTLDVQAAATAAASLTAHVYSRWWAYLIVALSGYWILGVKPSVYLLDFATFEPPAEWQVTHDDLLELIRLQGVYTEDSIDFQRRLLERSGTGQATHWPPTILRSTRPELAKFTHLSGSDLAAQAVPAPSPLPSAASTSSESTGVGQHAQASAVAPLPQQRGGRSGGAKVSAPAAPPAVDSPVSTPVPQLNTDALTASSSPPLRADRSIEGVCNNNNMCLQAQRVLGEVGRGGGRVCLLLRCS